RCTDGIDGALEVDVEHLVEVLAREIEERAVGADARVWDDDIDAAEALRGRVAKLGECFQIADVARLRDDALESEVAAAAGRKAEVAAAVVEHVGDRGADAAARPRDHCGLTS